MNNKVYLVILTEGDGDTYYKIIDQETYDWITSNDPGQPANVIADNYCWEDQLVPASQKSKIITPNDEPFTISSGSWENDRAIMCESADGYECYVDSIKDAMMLIQKNGDIFEDEYHGVMY